MYKTKGKNRIMLRSIKKSLNENLENYFKESSNRERLKEKIGSTFLKLAELATLRYRWNAGSMDVENIRGEIAYNLWRIIAEKKFNASRLKNENSTYSFFMMCANNIAKYEIRKSLNRNNKVPMHSLEGILMSRGSEGTDNLICKDFFRSDGIYL